MALDCVNQANFFCFRDIGIPLVTNVFLKKWNKTVAKWMVKGLENTKNYG